jgi:hypothetical protein
MRSIILLTVLIFIAGCATLKYEEPTEGPLARARFVANTDDVTVLRAYSDSNCSDGETEWMRLRAGPLLNSSPHKLGLPLWDYHVNSAKEVHVKANEPVNGMFYGSATTYRCAVPFSFAFDEGEDYEVVFDVQNRFCSVEISQFKREGDDWFRDSMATFTNRVDDSNSGCLADFRKSRLY